MSCSCVDIIIDRSMIFQCDADSRYEDRENDWRLRTFSLILCTIQGIFSGHVIHNIYVMGQPIPLVTPAAIAYSFAVRRTTLLTSSSR